MGNFWTEEIIEQLDLGKPQLFNDSKTPSGAVHMGSPISPAIHDAIYQQVLKKGGTAAFQFGFDDFDVVDGLSDDLMPTHEQYFGVPLFQVPPPPGSQAASFADHFMENYKAILKHLDIEPTFYRTSEIYTSGGFDEQIVLALDNAAKIREIYKTISGSEKSQDWLPMQVVCEQCGKLGTTKVVGWDGNLAAYRCEPAMVTWAKGCGHQGKISPLGGNGKMPWRVEWAAKWAKFGVTLEAAGKDHASKGSSFDVCTAICREVFDSPPPVTVSHEFILHQGKKMSSSKGVGVKGLEFVSAIPTTLSRFFYLRTRPNLAIDARPLSELIPRLFDDFDRLSVQVAGDGDEGQRTLWELSTMRSANEVVVQTVKFSTITQWLQMPNVDELQEAENLIGRALTESETAVIESKIRWAQHWLDNYAPAEDLFEVQVSLPEVSLSDEQKKYLSALAKKLKAGDEAEAFQQTVYELAKEMSVSSRDAFSAIYQVFLNKQSGPKAGWLLHSLDFDFVQERLEQASK